MYTNAIQADRCIDNSWLGNDESAAQTVKANEEETLHKQQNVSNNKHYRGPNCVGAATQTTTKQKK